MLWLIAFAGLTVAPGAGFAARCADPAPPFRVSQQAMLGAVRVRALEAPDTTMLPRLVLLDAVCRPMFATVFGRPDPLEQGLGKPTRLLRFRALAVPGMPEPVLLAVMASPGGSDTRFETQLFSARGSNNDRRFHALLPRAVGSLLEGGVFLGDLGPGIGPGFAAWEMEWGPGEAHVDPHRYRLRRWRWDGQGFEPLAMVATRARHGNPEAALRELDVGYRDMTRDFPDFAAYR